MQETDYLNNLQSTLFESGNFFSRFKNIYVFCAWEDRACSARGFQHFLCSEMNNDKAKKRKLLQVTNIYHLDQLISTRTRITERSSTLIDLLFTNKSHHVIDGGVIPSSLSDHCLIFCVIKSGVPKAPGRTIEYRSYKHYSKQEFLNDLRDIDWDWALNKDDIDFAVDDWNKLFTHVADSHAPIRKSRIKGVRSPWWM